MSTKSVSLGYSAPVFVSVGIIAPALRHAPTYSGVLHTFIAFRSTAQYLSGVKLVLSTGSGTLGIAGSVPPCASLLLGSSIDGEPMPSVL